MNPYQKQPGFVSPVTTKFLAVLAISQILTYCSSPKPSSGSSLTPPKMSDPSDEDAIIKEKTAKVSDGKKTAEFDPTKIFEDQTLIDAHYRIESAAIGTQVCKGFAKLKVYPGFKKDQPVFEVPEGKLDCGPLGTMDLTPMLRSFSVNPKDGNTVISENFVRSKLINGIRYEPARPVLPAFLSTKKEQLAKLNFAQKLMATDPQKNITAPGMVAFQMVSTGQEFRSVELRYTFRDVMHYKIICNGFEGTERGLTYCFDLAEWHLSLNPLAFLKMKFVMPASLLLESAKNNPEISTKQIDALIKVLPTAGGDGIVDGLVGEDADKLIKATNVEMTLVLEDQKNIGDSAEKNDSKEVDDQVVVGGK